MTLNELYECAVIYLNINAERFNDKEKYVFMENLNDWIMKKTDVISDDIYDFLIAAKLSEEKTREEQFASYLNEKYKNLRFTRIMDIGAGRMCKLSTLLAKNGARMYAIDPNIRLRVEESYKAGISKISNQKFVCDWSVGKNGLGTNVKPVDMLVGLEPCDATEHIIRQALKYEKPFDIALCATPHDSINGKKFRSYEEWYEYLLSISSEVDISKIGGFYIASNASQLDKGFEL